MWVDHWEGDEAEWVKLQLVIGVNLAECAGGVRGEGQAFELDDPGEGDSKLDHGNSSRACGGIGVCSS